MSRKRELKKKMKSKDNNEKFIGIEDLNLIYNTFLKRKKIFKKFGKLESICMKIFFKQNITQYHVEVNLTTKKHNKFLENKKKLKDLFYEGPTYRVYLHFNLRSEKNSIKYIKINEKNNHYIERHCLSIIRV